MGTNFYLRRHDPIEVRDEYHICKRSWGWRIHFQDSAEYERRGCGEVDYEDAEDVPRYRSAAEIRRLLESGKWDLSNEYGDVWSGQAALDEFDNLLRWCPDGLDNDGLGGDYLDPDGYRFTPVEFS